jgi:hypothetical protein
LYKSIKPVISVTLPRTSRSHGVSSFNLHS